jgi:hypothetical protein
MTGRNYPIWVDVDSCIYSKNNEGRTGNKSFGVRDHSEQIIKIGSSRTYSWDFAEVKLTRHRTQDGPKEIDTFMLFVDNTPIKYAVYNKTDHDMELITVRPEVEHLVKKINQNQEIS